MIRTAAHLSSTAGQFTPGRDALHALAFEPVKPVAPDFRLRYFGSVSLLTPLSRAAWDWIDENTSPDVPRWAGAVAIEPRFARDICEALAEDGYTFE